MNIATSMMRAVSLENHNFLKSEIDFYCANCDFLTAKEKTRLFYGYVSFTELWICDLAKEPQK